MLSPFQNPFMLGFEGLEEMLYRVAKGTDSFPPYNVEQISSELLRMTFAVAGYKEEELEVMQEGNQLMIRGHQEPDENRHFLHRGIAARSFLKSFILAEGMTIEEAHLEQGLLVIDLKRPEVKKIVRSIPVKSSKMTPKVLPHKKKK